MKYLLSLRHKYRVFNFAHRIRGQAQLSFREYLDLPF